MKKTLILALLLSLISACNSDTKVDIIVSTYATEYITKEIVKDNLSVKNIIPSGVDIHEYEPTQQDIKQANNASLVFFIDDHFDEVLSEIDNSISILNNLSESYDNPHFWTSPKKMIEAADIIYNQLIKEFSSYEEEFNANYLKLITELEALDNKYYESLNSTTNNTFIVSHNSFEHLKDYNIDTLPLTNSDHSDDNSQKKLLDIIDYVEENDISYIASEKGVICANCDIITNDTNAKVLVLDSFEFTDKSTNYIDIQYSNLEQLLKILN